MANRRWQDAVGIDGDKAQRAIVDVAKNPDGDARHRFDALFYPVLARYAAKRGPALARTVLRPSGSRGVHVPGVPTSDLNIVAHDTAVTALSHARRKVQGFRPGVDDPVRWVLSHAPFAYVDVVRKAYGRGPIRFREAQIAHLEAIEPAASPPSQEAVAEINRCLKVLSEQESLVFNLFHRKGCTYHEISEIVFGERGDAKKVGRVLERARKKLQAEWGRPRG